MSDKGEHQDRTEEILAIVLSLAAAAVARKAVNATWKASTGRTPPTTDPEISSRLSVVLLWGAATGAAVGAARMLAERQAIKLARKRAGATSASS